MKALDTNILVRFLTGDDDTQAKQVYQLFKHTEDAQEELYIPQMVVMELIWVLNSIYKFKRPALLKTLEDLTLMPIFKFENPSTIRQAVQEAKVTNLDFSDLLIAHSAKAFGIDAILTFDKKASAHNLFQMMS